MSGAFAHMIVGEMARQKAEQEGIHTIGRSLFKFPQWMQAGAVGPDYPYLHHLSNHDESDSWADLMHYEKTGDVVRAGAEWLIEYTGERDSDDFQRAAAWLAGYLSHVVLDASIHPVVRAIVGEYELNAKAHRVCEMYMDSYLFKETYGYELANDEWVDYLRHTTDESGDGMDRSIKEIWSYMLKKTYPDAYAKNTPDFDGWHNGYIRAVDIADNSLILFRHVATENGLLYADSTGIPPAEKVTYIEKVKTPVNNRFGVSFMHYKDVISFGVDNIIRYWKHLNAAIDGRGDVSLPELPNWNLDKGTIDPKGEGDATLWV